MIDFFILMEAHIDVTRIRTFNTCRSLNRFHLTFMASTNRMMSTKPMKEPGQLWVNASCHSTITCRGFVIVMGCECYITYQDICTLLFSVINFTPQLLPLLLWFLLPLHWRHNGRDSVSNHQPHDCLLRSCRRRSKKTSKLRVTGLCAGSPRRIPRTKGQ